MPDSFSTALPVAVWRLSACPNVAKMKYGAVGVLCSMCKEQSPRGLAKLYGHMPSEEQIDKILQIDMNSGSAGYEQFAAK